MKSLVFSFQIIALFILAGPAAAADFCVADAAGLAVALDIADNNGLSDTVKLVQGTYNGNFVYDANAAETGSLRVEGGYTAGCASRVADAANTVLAGAGGRTLRLDGNDNSGLVVDAITVRDGQSALGGAGLDIGRWTNVEVLASHFMSNQTTAGNDGSGGLNIDRSANVFVRANQFIGNTGGKGGGMSISDPVFAEIDANLFLANHAEQSGGAIDGDSAGEFVFTNNVIARNTAAEDAGGAGIKLFEDGTSGAADFTNNTVTANTAGQEAGGIELKMIGDSTSASLYNNIVYANTAALLGRDLFIDNDDEQNGVAASVALFNNDFDHSALGLFMAIPFAVDASNLNNVAPGFVDAATDNYRLSGSSLLIDAGSAAAPAMPAFDFDGADRHIGAAPDVGAFEVAVVDTDSDGVADDADNCTAVANPSQLDSNGDGYGNACDADIDNNGTINFADLQILKAAFFSNPAQPNWNPDADFNGDGNINFADLQVMSDSFFGAPGPSGLVP